MRHGHKFGAEPTFFAGLLPALVAAMGEAYPELVERQAFIREVLFKEGEQFARTLANGMGLLETAITALGSGTLLGGDTAFKLYDTYGFPADLTADICRERGLSLDQAGFDAAMEAQRDRARAASRFGVDMRGGADLGTVTTFSGYERSNDLGVIAALLHEGEVVDHLSEGQAGEVVLAQTPFYAESGGQVGDTGWLLSPGVLFEVADTRKRGAAYSHLGRLTRGTLRLGDSLEAQVDAGRRDHIRRNHSATHLLHAALREVLGTHVTQKGSLVTPERLRFDFAHHQPVTADELRSIEQRVNQQVRLNAEALTRTMGYDDAVAAGAMALFGEKYADEVRVLSIGSYSTELCGGTHVQRAGDIGLFKIVTEGGVAAGVRRIEALTGQSAIEHIEHTDELLRQVSGMLRGTREDVAVRVQETLDQVRSLEKQLRSVKDKLASGQGTDLAAGAVDVGGGAKLVATVVDGADATSLRNAVDQLKDKLKSAVIVLASVAAPDKVVLVAGVTADLVGRIKAGELVGAVAAQVGGKGGGRPDFAQAGGTQPEALPAALAGVAALVRAKLGG
jgi:alanyl-tRNA synthetase